MIVKELKELIKDLDDDVLVILASDSEGNRYSRLADGWFGYYVADNAWEGDCYGESAEVEEMDEEEYKETIKGGVKMVCLTPWN